MPVSDLLLKLEGVGSGLREMRCRCELTQATLAKEMGIDKARLSRIENNLLPLSLTLIDLAALALNMSSDVLLLYCLKTRYPKLLSTTVGRELQELLAK
jgi:transcriptional regulator with XRE-family HTH domain